MKFEKSLFSLFEVFEEVLFFVKDRDLRFIYANRALLRKLGFGRLSDIVGKTDRDMLPVYLADMFRKDDRRILATGRPLFNKTELVMGADRSVAWYQTSKVPLTDEAGRISGLAGVTRHLRESDTSEMGASPLRDTLQVIHTQFAEPLQIARLAAIGGISVSAFERRFKRSLGVSPNAYLKMVRIRKAAEKLVSGNAAIAEIALETGFSDQSHLTREFTKSMGITPRGYRMEYGVTARSRFFER